MPLTREQVDEVNRTVAVALKSKWMDDSLIKTISDAVSDSTAKKFKDQFDSYKTQLNNIEQEVSGIQSLAKTINEHDAKITSLQNEILDLQQKVAVYEKQSDDIQQYSRKNNLRLFGVAEDVNENTTTKLIQLVNSVIPNFNLLEADIDNCHRLGKKGDEGQHRPIIVKFLSYRKKLAILEGKKHLAKIKIFVNEDLTKHRYQILKSASEKLEKKNVWTRNGTICTRLNGKVITINSLDELNKIKP